MEAPVFQAFSGRSGGHDRPSPQITADGSQYAAYFENEYGEQLVFAYDRETGRGRLWHSDAGWGEPYSVEQGRASGLILSRLEQTWLSLCWEAASFGRVEAMRPQPARE